MKEYSLAEHLEFFKTIPDVLQVYITEPDFSVYQQVGDIPSVAFNIEGNNGMTFILVVPNDFWKYNLLEPALKFAPEWLKYLEIDPQQRIAVTFFFRPEEMRAVELKGSLKVEELPENAQLLADKLAEVEHVKLVKVRKLFDAFQLSDARTGCQESYQYYSEIDIRTGQTVPSISLYVPKRYWDEPEKHHLFVESLIEQIKIRLENSKRIFGEDNHV